MTRCSLSLACCMLVGGLSLDYAGYIVGIFLPTYLFDCLPSVLGENTVSRLFIVARGLFWRRMELTETRYTERSPPLSM
ncbi:hypothetical protein [Phormidium sp. CCY1219]|uniref:hypothetical protein n=1 Tax=Phormidium sp. CCY1219 TaxID=2886104 RepID=UPI002D1EE922|nr:hypothetical protein [Phormidium sp. CCY1219]MEB3827359.1 hypothetical protein [Phormidium sp. CCY1219]